jgi:hypothetical protein
MTMKLAELGIKPEQIKSASELTDSPFPSVQAKGIDYNIDHITIRQAVNLSFELERNMGGLKISTFDLMATPQDPHFYNLRLKALNFAPKVAAGGSIGSLPKETGPKKEPSKPEGKPKEEEI